MSSFWLWHSGPSHLLLPCCRLRPQDQTPSPRRKRSEWRWTVYPKPSASQHVIVDPSRVEIVEISTIEVIIQDLQISSCRKTSWTKNRRSVPGHSRYCKFLAVWRRPWPSKARPAVPHPPWSSTSTIKVRENGPTMALINTLIRYYIYILLYITIYDYRYIRKSNK